MLFRKGKAVLVYLYSSDIEPVLKIGAESAYPAVQVHDGRPLDKRDDVIDH